jgi:hypothetical protein
LDASITLIIAGTPSLTSAVTSAVENGVALELASAVHAALTLLEAVAR